MRHIALGAALAVALTAALALTPRAVPTRAATGDPTAFNGNGMWIWYVSQSGGSASAIASKANAHNIDTVYVKSADGPHFWSQFSKSLVDGLHAQGLKVCGWQYMYGKSARKEAVKAAKAVNEKGADCFVMDPEIEFEGRYVQADRYIKKFRNLVGTGFPLGLATFPYVHFHPALPYSVFLRPGDGGQFNLPQMYWKAIGDTPEETYSTTYRVNRPYERPISPLGQTFQNPTHTDVKQFRRWALEYGAAGVSWWSWQHTNSTEWDWVGEPVTPFENKEPNLGYAQLSRAQGSNGDLVIWAKEHLIGASYELTIGGKFGSGMDAAVRDFQSSQGLTPDGVIGKQTWLALLEVEPCNWLWGANQPRCDDRSSTASAMSATAVSGASAGPANPNSASLPARRYEIPPPAKRR